MGNEVSSVKVHNLLSAEDLKYLRTQFPGGGSGTPPSNLSWGLWKEAWPAELLQSLEGVLAASSVKLPAGKYRKLLKMKKQTIFFIYHLHCVCVFLVKVYEVEVSATRGSKIPTWDSFYLFVAI
jgi:hypothetical protein